MFKVKITGVEKIDRVLRELEPKISKRVIRKGMRAGLKIMLERARALTPVSGAGRNKYGAKYTHHASGTLKKAIKIKSTRSRKGIRMAILLSRQSFPDGEFYGGFRLEGTKKIKAAKSMEHAFKETAEQARQVSTDLMLQLIEEIRW
jgi:HK97 gp10 family phage protein